LIVPTIIFIAFTLLSAVGAFLILAHLKGRRAGLVAALATALFFIALFAGLQALLRSGGFG
jgi:drug/metabolite transporter superfamily protein YnfA